VRSSLPAATSLPPLPPTLDPGDLPRSPMDVYRWVWGGALPGGLVEMLHLNADLSMYTTSLIKYFLVLADVEIVLLASGWASLALPPCPLCPKRLEM
jgi:hypothetical protein